MVIKILKLHNSWCNVFWYDKEIRDINHCYKKQKIIANEIRSVQNKETCKNNF